MHELSIACSIVELVEESLTDERMRAVKVLVRIGRLSGIVKEALHFSFEVASQDSRVEGAILEIEEVAVTIHCGKCNLDTTLRYSVILRCEQCGELSGRILRGNEMELVSIEIEDGKDTDR